MLFLQVLGCLPLHSCFKWSIKNNIYWLNNTCSASWYEDWFSLAILSEALLNCISCLGFMNIKGKEHIAIASWLPLLMSPFTHNVFITPTVVLKCHTYSGITAKLQVDSIVINSIYKNVTNLFSERDSFSFPPKN